MANGSNGLDRLDTAGNGGGFVMGLLAGTVIGAGLGMLFAPKAGAELRAQLSDQADTLANTASEGYRKTAETAGEWAEKGQDMYDKAREAVKTGAAHASGLSRDDQRG